MSVERKDVEHVALLARLALTEEEIAMYTTELNAVLSFMDKLNELDTSQVSPTTHVLDLQNVFREDEVGQSMAVEDVVANAPEQRDGQFKVPRIL